jgi:hypothetical protein
MPPEKAAPVLLEGDWTAIGLVSNLLRDPAQYSKGRYGAA